MDLVVLVCSLLTKQCLLWFLEGIALQGSIIMLLVFPQGQIYMFRNKIYYICGILYEQSGLLTGCRVRGGYRGVLRVLKHPPPSSQDSIQILNGHLAR